MLNSASDFAAHCQALHSLNQSGRYTEKSPCVINNDKKSISVIHQATASADVFSRNRPVRRNDLRRITSLYEELHRTLKGGIIF